MGRKDNCETKVHYKCSECRGFDTRNVDEFLEHMSSQHRPQLCSWCSDCGICFDDVKLLVAHVDKQECRPGELIFPCGSPDCDFTTTIGRKLVDHVKSFHRGSTFTSCIKCKNYFTVPHCLVLHIQNGCNGNIKATSKRRRISVSDDENVKGKSVKNEVMNVKGKSVKNEVMNVKGQSVKNEVKLPQKVLLKTVAGNNTSRITKSQSEKNNKASLISSEVKCPYCLYQAGKSTIEFHCKNVHSCEYKEEKKEGRIISEGKKVYDDEDKGRKNRASSNVEADLNSDEQITAQGYSPRSYRVQHKAPYENRKKPCPLRFKNQKIATRPCPLRYKFQNRTVRSSLHYQCGYCLKKASSFQDIVSHHDSLHEEGDTVNCFFIPDLDEILAEHSGLYECTLCKKGPDVFEKLKHHWIDKHNNKTFRLKVYFCGTNGTSSSAFPKQECMDSDSSYDVSLEKDELNSSEDDASAPNNIATYGSVADDSSSSSEDEIYASLQNI